jgi:chromosome segregation ATPase
MFSLRALIDGIEKDVKTLEHSSSEQQSHLGNVTRLLEQITTQRTIIDQLLSELSELRTQLPSTNDNVFRIRREKEKAIKQKLQNKVAHLEKETKKVVGIYDAVRLEAKRAMEAANIYKEVIDGMKQARIQSLDAEKRMREAGEQMKVQNGSAKEAKSKSKILKEQSFSLDAKTFRQTKARVDALTKKEEELTPLITKIRNDLTELSQQSLKGQATVGKDKHQLLLDIDTIRDQSDHSQKRVEPLNESFQKMGQQLENVDKRVNKLMDSSGEAAEDSATARDQIQQVSYLYFD